MKRFLLIAILSLVLLVPTISMARTDVFLNFGIGIPAPIFVAPFVVAPPPVVVAPAPVVIAPPAVVVQLAPVVIGPRGWYVGKHRGWYKHHRHIKFED